jgi:hypothetical protein
MIHAQIPLSHELLQIPIADRVSEIPTDTDDDDLRFEVSSFEQCRSALFSWLPSLSDRPTELCNTSIRYLDYQVFQTQFETLYQLTQDDDLSVEMPTSEQCFDRNERLYSAIIPDPGLFAPERSEERFHRCLR